jgi:4-hydroxy-tetrahydrodipicolinate reductase
MAEHTIKVAVSGAGGRMGQTVCDAVEGAEDMDLVARADPALGLSLADAIAASQPDVVVDFTIPATAVENIRTCVDAGVHVVVGTTGFAIEEIRGLRGANVLVAPNFAIGAVLLMKFAAEAYKHMGKAEIIELHHDGKLDAPSGTAKHTAEQMRAAAPDNPDPPIHSVRLPGLVAHEEVILGDLGQTLTIRHDSIDRVSFMPGVLLAVRKVGTLSEPLTLGLDKIL